MTDWRNEAERSLAAAERIDEKHAIVPADGRDRTGAVMWHLGRASAFREIADAEDRSEPPHTGGLVDRPLSWD